LKQFATNTEVALTDGPMDDAPSFTADGATVIFTRRTGGRLGLFRVPLLGGEPRRLVDDAESGAVSPDGSQIAFVRSTAAAPGKIAAAQLMIAAADGSGERELLRAEGSGILGPSWSLDGKKISVNFSGVGGGSFSLRTVDVATGAVTTTVAASAGSRPWGHRWSPAGQLLYSNGEVAAGSLAGTTGRIYSLDTRSGKQSLLFASPDMLGRLSLRGVGSLVVESQTVRQNLREWDAAGPSRVLTEGRASDRQPIYSPDGQWIVFSSDRSGNLDLWARSTRNGELRPLTDDAAQDWDPGFTPDGRLLWSSNRTGNFEIWIADGDGSGARQLSHDGVDAENPAASPDGKWIVYGSTRPGEVGLWRMGADGSAPKLLVHGLVGIPDVSPDGRHIVCLGFSGNLLRSGPQVVTLSDGAPVPFAVDMDQVRVTTANVGRARWLPDGRGLAFMGQDEKGLDGIFAQDFVAGRDTRATRRKLAGFQPGVEAETFAISADGKRVVVAGREMVSSLVLVEGLDEATAAR
jgi:Tol biopolymer transport system component